MTKVIKITTEQYNRYIFEGIDYKKQGTQYDAAPIDFSINQDKTDKGNIGKNSVDTRVFGNKQDILHEGVVFLCSIFCLPLAALIL